MNLFLKNLPTSNVWMVVYKISTKCTIYSVQCSSISLQTRPKSLFLFCQSVTDRPVVVPTGNECFPTNLFLICGSTKKREDSDDSLEFFEFEAEFPWQQLLQKQPRYATGWAQPEGKPEHAWTATTSPASHQSTSPPIISFICLSFFSYIHSSQLTLSIRLLQNGLTFTCS